MSPFYLRTVLSAVLLSLAAPIAMAAEQAITIDPKECDKPDYPARWINEGDTGNVVVAYLVGANGKVLESRLVESSGYPRIDRASLRAGASCKFNGGASGQSAASWAKVKYTWVAD